MASIKSTTILLLILSTFLIGCQDGCTNAEEKRRQEQILAQQAEAINLQKEQLRKEEEAKEQQRQFAIAITNLLAEDERVAINTNRNAILYAPQMRGINMSNCPSDFATAYLDHIQAWEDAAKIKNAQQQLNDAGGVAIAAGLIAELLKSDATPFSNYLAADQKLKELALEASEKIAETWKVVEHIAVSYGATLPSANQATRM